MAGGVAMAEAVLSGARAGESFANDFHRDGFVIIRNVFHADEMAVLSHESDTLFDRRDLVDTKNIRCRWQEHVLTGECVFDCFDPVIDIGPVCRYFAYNERILDRLQAIYNDSAYLFKDKLIFKSPGAQGYSLHQDFIGWNDFPRSFVTVLVAIDAADEENGATEVFPGYHHRGYLSPLDGQFHELPVSTVDESCGVLLNLAVGDIAIFSGFTPHRSAANHSDRWRRQLYLSYNAGQDGGNRRLAHYDEFHQWLKVKYGEYGKTDIVFQ